MLFQASFSQSDALDPYAPTRHRIGAVARAKGWRPGAATDTIVSMVEQDAQLADHAVDLCQRLLRIDTTNPPGNERPAADLCATELREAGLEPVILESAPGRANVVARHRGTGEKPPLLLTAHLDVVEADPTQWRYPPFSGTIAEGCLWGRGAIDMKNHAAMSIALICKLAREEIRLERDIIFAGVADEEMGCEFGSGFLVDEHPDLVRAEFALGEGGGFNIHLAGKRFFTLQVAEKGFCWVKARTHGEPGHGSLPRTDSAVYKLAAALGRLGKRGLPFHETPVVRRFLEAITAAQPRPIQPLLKAVAQSGVLPQLVKRIPDPGVARGVSAMLANTASPTVLRAGDKTNVIPGVAEAHIDGRTLPGQSDADFVAELAQIMGEEVEFEVMRSAPPTVTEPAASPLYDTIVQVMAAAEPDAVVVPYLLPGFTDAKSFSKLGTRWYGFAPVKLPRDMRFADMFHGHNERIPVEGLRWGTEILRKVVVAFAGASSKV